MKKHEIIFSVVKVPLDFAIIFASFFLAREIRLKTDLIPWVSLPVQTIDTESLAIFALLWWVLYVSLLATHGLYKIKITSSKIKELLDIIRYSFYCLVFFLVVIYIWKDLVYEVEIPRLIVLFSFMIGSLTIIIERILLNNLQFLLLNKKIIEKKRLILINNKSYAEIKDIIKDIKKTKVYKIIWYINKKKLGKKLSKIKYLWEEKSLKEILKKGDCDEIIYIESDFSKKQLYTIWDLSKVFWVRYRYITNSFDITKTNTSLSLINSIPVIEFKNTLLLDSWWRVLKRSFDILASIIAIVLFFPLMVLVGVAIKFTDPSWPIIYKNKRVWQNWVFFKLYKFRYMKWKYCIKDSYWVNPKKDKALKYEKELIDKSGTRLGPLYKIKNDPRKTKIWRFIEHYSIDELPQLFNVFIWNMSLVWPRPHQPREVKKYKIKQLRLLTIKPWITWMAQVNWREKNNFENEAKMDIFYIENWNTILDLKIILKTFWIIFNRK